MFSSFISIEQFSCYFPGAFQVYSLKYCFSPRSHTVRIKLELPSPTKQFQPKGRFSAVQVGKIFIFCESDTKKNYRGLEESVSFWRVYFIRVTKFSHHLRKYFRVP